MEQNVTVSPADFGFGRLLWVGQCERSSQQLLRSTEAHWSLQLGQFGQQLFTFTALGHGSTARPPGAVQIADRGSILESISIWWHVAMVQNLWVPIYGRFHQFLSFWMVLVDVVIERNWRARNLAHTRPYHFLFLPSFEKRSHTVDPWVRSYRQWVMSREFQIRLPSVSCNVFWATRAEGWSTQRQQWASAAAAPVTRRQVSITKFDTGE